MVLGTKEPFKVKIEAKGMDLVRKFQSDGTQVVEGKKVG